MVMTFKFPKEAYTLMLDIEVGVDDTAQCP